MTSKTPDPLHSDKPTTYGKENGSIYKWLVKLIYESESSVYEVQCRKSNKLSTKKSKETGHLFVLNDQTVRFLQYRL